MTDEHKQQPKQVIVMRTDLNMRKGKMIAQGAHASLKVILDKMVNDYQGTYMWKRLFIEFGSPLDEWINLLFKKIAVKAPDLRTVLDVYEKAQKENIPCTLIQDAGLTEFGGENTITCCAIGPDDPEKIDKITGHLNLL